MKTRRLHLRRGWTGWPTTLWRWFLCWPLLLAAACGGPASGGLQAELIFRIPDAATSTRGALSGIVDSVRLVVDRGGKPIAEQSCGYEALSCVLAEVPAARDYRLTAEALAGTEVLYRGTTEGVEVVADVTTPVAVMVEPVYAVDSFAPAAPDDLQAVVNGSAIDLSWTATGDDGRLGRASAYRIYWAGEPITEANLATANPVDGPRPAVAGTPESLTVRGLPTAAQYYFRLKVVDEADNASELSNESDATLP